MPNLFLQSADPVVADLIEKEKLRQQNCIDLIPSENYVSKGVLEALGSEFTNKYSEGYPGRRYYGGQINTDVLETLAKDRAKQLFKVEHANVQPLSGAPANLAVYFALLQPGDTVLGMDLSHGGHLTHGHPVTHPAKIFNFIRYKTTSRGELDYDEIEEMAVNKMPKIILCGYSSFPGKVDYAKIKTIADKVGAITMMDAAHIAGIIAAGLADNPFDFGFDIMTTTTHKTLRGPRGGLILCRQQFAEKIDKSVFPGLQGGPHMNNIAAKAVCFGEALQPEFKTYIEQVLANAQALSSAFKQLGVKLVADGTQNHMMVINVINSYEIGGKEAQSRLEEIGIITNMNVVPDDSRSPIDPGGLRLGTPAITTRGATEQNMSEIANIINKALSDVSKQSYAKLSSQVKLLAQTLIIK